MAMDGGPAFPQAIASDWAKGMSLRDWFAGQALSGMLGNSGIRVTVGPEPGNDNPRLAACAFAVADAMLAAREVRS